MELKCTFTRKKCLLAQPILLTVRCIFAKEFLNLVKLLNFCRSPNYFHLKCQHFVSWPSFEESGQRGLCDIILEGRTLHSRMFLCISAIEETNCTSPLKMPFGFVVDGCVNLLGIEKSGIPHIIPFDDNIDYWPK